MRLNYILSAISTVLIGFGMLLFIPVLVALYYHEFSSIMPFVASACITIISGFILRFCAGEKQNSNDLRKKEGLFIVSLAWIALSIVAGLPFLFYGINPLDAIFEGVACITTTGVTLLNGFNFPKTLYFWATFGEWIGGMGVIVLFIAILPQFAVAGRQMFFAEVPGPTEDKITPRIKQTAAALWGIYVALTVLEVIFLKLNGIPLFDSICNSFATISASGFSYNQLSEVSAIKPGIIWIGIIFMFLGGINFSLLYRIIVQKHWNAIKNSTEFKTYLAIFFVVSLFTVLSLMAFNGYDLQLAIRNSFYQVISILTSNGSVLPDFEYWPRLPKLLFIILTLVGGSAGSASGGIKVVRVIMMFKCLWKEIIHILHPNAIVQTKLGKTIISEEISRQIIAFILFYFIILIISSILVSALENDLFTGVMGSMSTLGNVNPLFTIGSHGGSFETLSPLTKIIFAFNMLVGRLELIPIIVMLHPDFWKFSKTANK